MEKLKELLNGVDPLKLLPDLSTMLGKLELFMRAAVLIAPLVLLGLGLLYFLASPREANYRLGYRFFWAMSSVEVWQFTQKLAGIVWAVLGLVMSVVMAVLSGRFRGMEADAMTWFGIRCILWELGIVVVSIIAVDITVVCLYDHNGVRRRDNRKIS